RTAAVLALGDYTLEVDVLQRMVLGFHRQPLVGGVERRPLRHRPAFQYAAEFEPQVVMVGGRVVLVDDEAVALPRRHCAGGLRCLPEVALRAVLPELPICHGAEAMGTAPGWQWQGHGAS